MIDSGGGQGMGGTKGIKMLRMLRLAKMLRLGRLKRILQRYAEELQPYVKVVKLGGMLLIAGFMGHLLASVWSSYMARPRALLISRPGPRILKIVALVHSPRASLRPGRRPAGSSSARRSTSSRAG